MARPDPSPERSPAALLVAILAALPAVALVATDHGRALSSDGFLDLRTVYLPASGALVLAGLALWQGAEGRRRWAWGSVEVLGGVAIAFTAARVLSTPWLLIGRRLVFDARLVTTLAGATFALAAGSLAVVQGLRLAGAPKGPRRTAMSAAVGIVAAPLVPWFVLKGEGWSILLFNDFTEPAFSTFPADPLLQAAMWLTVAGLALVAVTALIPADSPAGRGPAATLLLVAGFLVVAIAYAVVGWRAARIQGPFPAGIWPTMNPLTLAGAIGALWFSVTSSATGKEDVSFEQAGAP